MNIRQVMLSAAALLSAGTLSAAGELSADAKDLVQRTDVNRQAVVHRGDFLVRQGHRLFEEKNYLGARDKYLEAIKLFERYPSRFFQDKVDFCRKEIAPSTLSRNGYTRVRTRTVLPSTAILLTTPK